MNQVNDQSKQSSTKRLSRLDGLRAVAIIWVFVFHLAFYWAPINADAPYALLPYGDVLAFIPLAEVGYLGVSLFFLISGQVILMTLERTTKIFDFIVKRAARLWPTMFLCGTLTFITVSLFGPAQLDVGIPEYLISLLMLPPSKIGPIFGAPDWQWLDGAYWSLWVEVRFYALIALIFYGFKKHWLLVWLAFNALCFGFTLAVQFKEFEFLEPVASILIYEYVPYFSLGMLAHLHISGHKKPWIKWVVFALILQIATNKGLQVGIDAGSIPHWIGLTLALGLYGRTIVNARETKWLERIAGIGRASYSFYLLHQVFGISLIFAGAKLIGATASVFLVLPLFILLVFMSSWIYEKYEQPLNKIIVKKLTRSS